MLRKDKGKDINYRIAPACIVVQVSANYLLIAVIHLNKVSHWKTDLIGFQMPTPIAADYFVELFLAILRVNLFQIYFNIPYILLSHRRNYKRAICKYLNCLFYNSS